jgi:hypothetical protein
MTMMTKSFVLLGTTLMPTMYSLEGKEGEEEERRSSSLSAGWSSHPRHHHHHHHHGPADALGEVGLAAGAALESDVDEGGSPGDDGGIGAETRDEDIRCLLPEERVRDGREARCDIKGNGSGC